MNFTAKAGDLMECDMTSQYACVAWPQKSGSADRGRQSLVRTISEEPVYGIYICSNEDIEGGWTHYSAHHVVIIGERTLIVPEDIMTNVTDEI